MHNISREDLLSVLCGDISHDTMVSDEIKTVISYLEMQNRQKYLDMHVDENGNQRKIWYASDGRWATKIPYNGKLKLIKYKDKETLENYIIEFYKGNEITHCFIDVAKQWLQSRLDYGYISNGTYDRYMADLARYIIKNPDAEVFALKEKDIKTITQDDIERLSLKTIKNMALSGKAWQGMKNILLGTFKYAKKQGYTQLSIIEFFEDLELSRKMFRKTESSDERSVFNDNEIAKILKYIRERPDNILNLGIVLTFQTGLRIGELSALKPEDIRGETLMIRRSETRYKINGKNAFVVQDTTKGKAGCRNVQLTKEAIVCIGKIRKLNPNGEYLFMKKRNNKYERCLARHFSDALARICRYLKIPVRREHKVRKTVATKLIDAGVNENIVTAQLGHMDFTTTKRYYYFNNHGQAEMNQEINRALKDVAALSNQSNPE